MTLHRHLSSSVALALAALLLAGCTGVPTDTAPLVVRTIDHGGPDGQANITPKVGAQPRDLVTDFLTASVAADARHSQARQFLTNAASRKWQDNAVTVLNEVSVGVATITGAGTARVEVSGPRVGGLDDKGVYTPSLKGVGIGDVETFSYDLVQVEGEWRINQLQPGVLLSKTSFDRSYQARRLYFYDLSETVLVPDLRYSALGGQALATWLLTALVTGPRPELTQSVINEVPDKVTGATVENSDPIKVEMPGTSQLDANGRNRLAAQLAYTLTQIRFASGTQLTLTDSGRPVAVPAGHGPTFVAADFSSALPDSVAPAAEPYFVRAGAVIKGTNDKPIAGPLGQPGRGLTSVALRHTTTGELQVAAVGGNRLQVGSTSRLVRVRLPAGVLSRPEWRPRTGDADADAWVGVGTRGSIYRVGMNGIARQVSITSSVGGLPLGQVTALRFSPDGVRLAAVLRGADGTLTAWIGSVVVSSSDIRIDAFQPFTPAELAISDLAWTDATKLLLLARKPGDETRVQPVSSDGSEISKPAYTTAGLPGPATSIAAAPQQLPLVSASDSIWILESGGWKPYPGDAATPGINPVFAPW